MVTLSAFDYTIDAKTVCILLVRGNNPDGRPIFAYVAVRADTLETFMETLKTGVFYPEDHGIIIEAGEGEPSDEIRKKMETEYGFDHLAVIDVPDSKKAQDIAADLADVEGTKH